MRAWRRAWAWRGREHALPVRARARVLVFESACEVRCVSACGETRTRARECMRKDVLAFVACVRACERARACVSKVRRAREIARRKKERGNAPGGRKSEGLCKEGEGARREGSNGTKEAGTIASASRENYILPSLARRRIWSTRSPRTRRKACRSMPS
eukprot:3715982-Pleurochrysis_carterae.AAC.1